MNDLEAARREAEQDYASETAEAAERLKNQITFAERLFQGLILLNGGALVSLFTFIAAAPDAKGEMRMDPLNLWYAFAAFAAGLALTLLSITGAFFSQRYFYDQAQHAAWNAQAKLAGRQPLEDVDGPNRKGNSAMGLGIIAAVLALAAFIAGCAFSLEGVLPS